MFASLKGVVLSVAEKELVLDCNGIGFLVHTHPGMAGLIPEAGQEYQLFVHLVVKEDSLELFGFSTLDERELFVTLLGVPGIGPKTAQALISTYNTDQLAVIVETSDVKALSRVSGIGPKTAERLLVELRAPMKRLGKLAGGGKAPARGGAGVGSIDLDVQAALDALGFRRTEYEGVIARVRREGFAGDTAGLLKEVLRRLGR